MVRGHCRDQSGATASMTAYHRSGGPDLSLVFNFEGSGKQETGRFGFTLEWESSAPSFRSYDPGTWTVTAP